MNTAHIQNNSMMRLFHFDQRFKSTNKYDQVNDLHENKYGPGTTGNILIFFFNKHTFVIHMQRLGLSLTQLCM